MVVARIIEKPMAAVFGVDVQALLDREHSEAFSGSVFTYDPKEAGDKSGEGTLFGSLINRGIDTQSSMYREAAFSLGIPELQNEQPELFEVARDGEMSNGPIKTGHFQGPGSDSEPTLSGESFSDEAQETYIRSPYLLEAGREDVTKAMYSSHWKESFKGE